MPDGKQEGKWKILGIEEGCFSLFFIDVKTQSAIIISDDNVTYY